MSAEQPRFRHSHCSGCTFLGRHGEHDLYFCPQGGQLPTVIARYGDGGPDYTSGMLAAKHVPALAEARIRAVSRGLICDAA